MHLVMGSTFRGQGQFKKIPVLENEEFLHQKIIDESKSEQADSDEATKSE